MFRIRDIAQLQPEESTLLLVRKHFRTAAGSLVLAGLLIVAPFFFLFPLIRAGGFGVMIFCLLLAVGTVYALRTFIVWDSHVLLLTKHRVIHVEQMGVWRRLVREIPLHALEQVYIERRGAADVFCKTGTLRLRSNGHGTIIFTDVAHPEMIAETIERARPQSQIHAASNFQLKPL